MSAKVETIGMLSALAVGAGLMYILDPDRGQRRRTRLRRQLAHTGRQATHLLHDARKWVPALLG